LQISANHVSKKILQKNISKKYFKKIFQKNISKKYFKKIFQKNISKKYFKKTILKIFHQIFFPNFWLSTLKYQPNGGKKHGATSALTIARTRNLKKKDVTQNLVEETYKRAHDRCPERLALLRKSRALYSIR
jgi:hypothetical protein